MDKKRIEEGWRFAQTMNQDWERLQHDWDFMDSMNEKHNRFLKEEKMSAQFDRKMKLKATVKGVKLHLSGPMTGIDEMNKPLFDEVAEWLRKKGYKVFNPHDLGLEMPYREALLENLKFICTEADGIVFLPGHRKSKGSLAEDRCAAACGLPYYFVNKTKNDMFLY